MCCAIAPSFLGEAAYVHVIYAAHNDRCSPAQQHCRWPRAQIIQTLINTSRFSLRCCDTWSRDLFHLAQALTLSRRMFSLPELITQGSRGGERWAASMEHGSSKARVWFAGSSSEENWLGLGKVVQVFQFVNTSPWTWYNFFSYRCAPHIQTPLLCRSKSRIFPAMAGSAVGGLTCKSNQSSPPAEPLGSYCCSLLILCHCWDTPWRPKSQGCQKLHRHGTKMLGATQKTSKSSNKNASSSWWLCCEFSLATGSWKDSPLLAKGIKCREVFVATGLVQARKKPE